MGKKKKQSTSNQDPNNRVITTNRRARHNFELLTTYDAGLVLIGSEVKSVRAGKVNLADGYIQELKGELWLMNVHIGLYEQASHFGHTDPMRPRKLLLHKKEIARIITDIREISYTAVATKMYLTRGLVKVQLATARGKKLYDKRDDLRKRDSKRRIERALKDY